MQSSFRPSHIWLIVATVVIVGTAVAIGLTNREADLPTDLNYVPAPNSVSIVLPQSFPDATSAPLSSTSGTAPSAATSSATGTLPTTSTPR